jgi:uncharacterized protein (DUF1330 family)
MKAYAIAAETIKDQAMFDAYRKVVPETLVPFGGQFIARGGNLTVLEGEWPHPRLVIIEFPSRAAAEGWYRSAAYQKVISLRLNSSVGNHRAKATGPERSLQERRKIPSQLARWQRQIASKLASCTSFTTSFARCSRSR